MRKGNLLFRLRSSFLSSCCSLGGVWGGQQALPPTPLQRWLSFHEQKLLPNHIPPHNTFPSLSPPLGPVGVVYQHSSHSSSSAYSSYSSPSSSFSETFRSQPQPRVAAFVRIPPPSIKSTLSSQRRQRLRKHGPDRLNAISSTATTLARYTLSRLEATHSGHNPFCGHCCCYVRTHNHHYHHPLQSRPFFSSSTLSSSTTSSSWAFSETTNNTTNDNNKNTKKRSKIAILGAGAVGSYYGARLWEAGHDVHFYARSIIPNTKHHDNKTDDRSNNSNGDDDDDQSNLTNGLHISSIAGDMMIPFSQWQVYHDVHHMIPTQPPSSSFSSSEPSSILDVEGSSNAPSAPAFDWIIITLKSTALHVIPELLGPLLRLPNSTATASGSGDATNTVTTTRPRVLVIMNGLIEVDLIPLLQQQLPHNHLSLLSRCRTVYGGMALICCNRISPNQIRHSYAGLLAAGVAATTTSASTPTTSTKDNDHNDSDNDDDDPEAALIELFQGSKVSVLYETNLLWGRWKKMIWNIPFNGISVVMGGITVDQIVQNPGLRQLAELLMDETIAIGNADLQQQQQQQGDRREAELLPPLGEVEKNQMMQLSDNMGAYRTSTMLDWIHGRPMEIRYLFREPLNRADQLGIPAPHLRTMVALLEAYNNKSIVPHHHNRHPNKQQ